MACSIGVNLELSDVIVAQICLHNQIMDDKTIATELTNYSGMGDVDYYVLPLSNGEFPCWKQLLKQSKIYGRRSIGSAK